MRWKLFNISRRIASTQPSTFERPLLSTLTSFRFGRQLLSPRQWKLLHKSGIYFLWAYAFSVYWWALFYYPSPSWIDYVFYWGGFLAWGLRAAAWSKKRRQRAEKASPQGGSLPVVRLTGVGIIGFGWIAAGFGSIWRQPAEELLTGYAITRIPELYLPYWPFEPFLPLLITGLGAFLWVKSWAARPTEAGRRGVLSGKSRPPSRVGGKP